MVLPPDPPWVRPLAVFGRVPPTGAAEAFVGLLGEAWPLPGPGARAAPAGPHGAGGAPAAASR